MHAHAQHHDSMGSCQSQVSKKCQNFNTPSLGKPSKKKLQILRHCLNLALPSPPLSPIETYLIETFPIFFYPSPQSLQLKHNFF